MAFWKWIILSIIHGATTFYVVFKGIEGVFNPVGRTYDHWMHSTLTFTVITHLVNYKLFLETSFWNLISM